MSDASNINLSVYYANHSDPDAIVILNRGDSEHQLDVTDSVISLNTTNSIDSLTGSFNVTLDNTDDFWIDRFNFSRIKKMSSIEIFVKPPQSFVSDNSGNNSISGSLKSNATSLKVPRRKDANGRQTGPTTLTELVNEIFGKDNTASLKNQIKELNKDRFTTVPGYTTGIQNLYSRRITYEIKGDSGAAESCKLVFTFTPTSSDEPSNLTLQIFRPSGYVGNIVTVKDGYLSYPAWKIKSVKKDGSAIEAEGENVQLPRNLSQFTASIFLEIKTPLTLGDGETLNEAALEEPILIPIPSGLYQRIFFGIVTTISHNTSPGSALSVVMSGKGIGYWLEASVINLNPGGFEVETTGQELSGFANRMAQRKAMDVFKELISIGTGNIPANMNLNLTTVGTSFEVLKILGDNAPGETDNAPVDKMIAGLHGGSEKFIDPATGEPAKGWKPRLAGNNISGQIRDVEKMLELVYRGFSPSSQQNLKNTNLSDLNRSNVSKSNCEDDQVWVDNSRAYADGITSIDTNTREIEQIKIQINSLSAVGKDANKEEIEKKNKTIEGISKKITNTKAKIETYKSKLNSPGVASYKYIRGLEITQKELKTKINNRATTAGRDAFLNSFGIIEHWKKLFSNIILETMEDDSFLNNIYPFNYAQKSPGPSFDGDYVSKATLGKQIADYMQYEFYFDSNGHFVLKPPLYNVDHRLMGNLYEIEDVDVIACSINDTSEGIVTRIGVAGDFRENPGVAPKEMLYNIFQDMHLIKDYGWFQKDISNLYYVTNPTDAKDFGQAYMARSNMNLFNGSITIHGRPNIRIGTSVYFKPRDTVFYIREISHELTAGGGYQTTINVTGGRRVLVGFKSKLKARIIRSTVKDGKKILDTTDPNFTGPQDGYETINHYFLARGINSDAIVLNNFQDGIPDDQIQPDQEAARVAGITPKSPNTLYILKNKYIISNHPNPAFIGLVVDKENGFGVLAQINVANYKYFYDLTKDNIPSENIKSLFPLKTEQETIALKIRDYFREYARIFGFKDTTFDMSVRDQFINDFLSSVQQATGAVPIVQYDEGLYESQRSQARDFYSGKDLEDRVFQIESENAFAKGQVELRNILSAGLKPDGNGVVTELDSKTKLRNLSSVFNSLVNYIDNNGNYRQYTDKEGREIPAYQNFGLGYGIAGKTSKISNVIETDRNLKNTNDARKSLAENVAGRSRSMSGIYDPSSSEYKKILLQSFAEYRNVIGAPKATDPKAANFPATKPGNPPPKGQA